MLWLALLGNNTCCFCTVAVHTNLNIKSTKWGTRKFRYKQFTRIPLSSTTLCYGVLRNVTRTLYTLTFYRKDCRCLGRRLWIECFTITTLTSGTEWRTPSSIIGPKTITKPVPGKGTLPNSWRLHQSLSVILYSHPKLGNSDNGCLSDPFHIIFYLQTYSLCHNYYVFWVDSKGKWKSRRLPTWTAASMLLEWRWMLSGHRHTLRWWRAPSREPL